LQLKQEKTAIYPLEKDGIGAMSRGPTAFASSWADQSMTCAVQPQSCFEMISRQTDVLMRRGTQPVEQHLEAAEYELVFSQKNHNNLFLCFFFFKASLERQTLLRMNATHVHS